ncbi:MAG: hypothetical protein ACPGJV_02940, partial [Bacteriovoracaceae bacterium]
MKTNTLSKILLGTLFLTLFIMPLIGNIVRLNNSCIHATDFSIYQQAIYDIADGVSLNPYITIRNVKIFNDHFDPVILIAAVFTKIFQYSPESLLVFEYLWFFGFLALVWKSSKALPLKTRITLLFCGLFLKGILSGLQYPIHPTTWSLFPAALLVLFIYKNSFLGIALSGIAICFFKESFAFSLFTLGLYRLIIKKDKKSSLLVVISILILVFNFHFRSVLLGPTIGYGAQILKPYLENPFKALFSLLGVFEYKAFLKLFFPFLLWGILSLKNSKKEDFKIQSPVVETFAFLLPIFAIQFIANNFHFQYGAQISAPLFMIFLLSRNSTEILKSKKVLSFITIAFITSAMGSHTKAYRTVFAPKNKFCLIGNEKKSEDIQKLKDYLEKNYNGETIIASGSIPPQ